MRGIFILFADIGHKGHDLVSPLSRENTVITKGVLCKTPIFFHCDTSRPIYKTVRVVSDPKCSEIEGRWDLNLAPLTWCNRRGWTLLYL